MRFIVYIYEYNSTYLPTFSMNPTHESKDQIVWPKIILALATREYVGFVYNKLSFLCNAGWSTMFKFISTINYLSVNLGMCLVV